MMDERKKGNHKMVTIAGIAAGTCILSAAAFFLADSGLAFLNTKIEQTDNIKKESETNTGKEENVTESENIAKSEDSFTVSRVKETNTGETEREEANGQNYYENPDQGTDSGDTGTGTDFSWNNNGSDVTGGNNSGYEGEQSPGQNITEAPDNGSYGNDADVPGGNGTDFPDNPASEPTQTEPPQTEPPSTEVPGQDDNYIIADINKRYISEDELYNLTAEEIAAARNEIFARHGRIFTNQKWSDYFHSKSWYVPKYSKEQFDSLDLFNSFEKANLKVILAYESKLS